MKLKILFMVFPVLACLLVSCQTFGAVRTANEDITPEQEYYIGRAVAANILGSYRGWNGNPALTNYLNFICAAITANSSPQSDVFNGYHVAILDSNEINAFATPGGHILVTRGLIAAANSEDALAGVIAHEIAHIHLKHGINSISASRRRDIGRAFTQDLRTGLAIAGLFSSTARQISQTIDTVSAGINELVGLFGYSVNDIINSMVVNGYSRRQELEADNYAMTLMSAAGYNPQGLIDMLRQLSVVQVAGSGFGRTHPAPSDRLTNAESTILNFNVADNSAFRRARFAEAAR